MVYTQWIVLSGTTSSGKSTISLFFKRLGYPVVPDLTRVYIDTLLSKGFTIEQIRSDKSMFFNKVHKLRLWVEDTLAKYIDTPIVFDRAVPETIAYARVDNFDESSFWETIKEYRYRTVYMPKPLPFVADGMRTNNPERRLQVFDELKGVYTSLGYDIIEIPVLSVEKREQYIEKHLEVMETKSPKNSGEVKAYIEDVMGEFVTNINRVSFNPL